MTMGDQSSPFLSAGLPGLTFGLSLGRGLSIQIDPSGTVADDPEELNPPDEQAFVNDTTLPSAFLVLHFYAVHDLVVDIFDFEDGEKIFVYATFAIGSTKKASQQHLFKNSSAPVIFNEVKYIPLEVTLTPNQHINKLVVLVYACSETERFNVSRNEHKMIGRYEAHMHTLLKFVNGHEKMSVLSKKGVTVGEIEFEFGVTYGSFGYGQSYQLKSDVYTPEDLAKTSMLPRLIPQESNVALYKGTPMYPRKLKHPSYIPVFSEPVEDFEPPINPSYGSEGMESPDFPLMTQHMQRLSGLMSTYKVQNTRSKRICFLRKLLQDGAGNADDAFDEVVKDTNDKPAPIPAALALMMNTSKFLSQAPGINRRRSQMPRLSLPSQGSSTRSDKLPQKPRSHSLANPADFEAMKDKMFTRRRQSLAPTIDNEEHWD